MTAGGGQVGYSGIGSGGSLARSSIATLVLRPGSPERSLPSTKATLRYVREQPGADSRRTYAEYTLYYQSQALFQGDVEIVGESGTSSSSES